MAKDVLSGQVYDLGSKKKNLASAKRRLKRSRYKVSNFKVSVNKARGCSAKFIAIRK